MPQQQTEQYALSEATAIRLFNSVVASSATPPLPLAPEPASAQVSNTNREVSCNSDRSNDSQTITAVAPPLGFIFPSRPSRQSMQESIHSANEWGNSCRICRWNRSDMEIISCPCKCKGSVGFVHLKCLKRWIMHRRDNRCEICNASFEISEDHGSLKQMVRTFCCSRCCGLIVKHLLFSASLMPLAHVILQQVRVCAQRLRLLNLLITAYLRFFNCVQVLQCMDNLNQGCTEQLTVQEVFVASCALLTSSALFFHFFEFVTTRCLLIRNILRHWWMFGSTSDFALVDIDDDSVDFF